MCITEAAISQEYDLERDCRRNILYVYWGYTEEVWHCPKQTHCLGSAVIHEGKNKWTNGHEFLLMAFLYLIGLLMCLIFEIIILKGVDFCVGL